MGDVDRASISLFGARVLSQALGFASVVYFADQIGADGLGIYFTFVTVVSVTGVFAKVGLAGATVKRMNQAVDTAGRSVYLSSALLLHVPPFLLTAAVLVLAGPRLDEYVGLAAAVPLAVAAVALSVGGNLLTAALRGEDRVELTAVVDLLNQVVRLAVSVALLLLDFGVIALVFGHMVGNLSRSLSAYAMLEARFTIPTREAAESLFDFSKYTAGMNVSALAYNWTDTLVLAYFASKAAVGIYETVWMISAVTLLAAQVLGSALAPSMTRWHEDGRISMIETAFSTAMSFALVLVLPAIVGALVLGEELLGTLYGYDQGALVLVVLLVGQVAAAVQQVTQNTLFGIDRPDHVFWTNVLSLAANVGLNVLLVPEFGMIGAAAATLTTAAVAAVSQVVLLRRYIDVRINPHTIGWQVLASVAMGVVVAGLAGWFPLETKLGLLALVGIGGGVYGVTVLANDEVRGRLLGTELW
ncbi:oligosaccharide flippase family protein [Haloarchaeobius sp. TZWWS8]|uniref:oligosaccharide flippase family protein n=1 Tax=Haloarchaeobius sp. TZWWS8 TaxID=3446121 RepID=UPI003EBFAE77